MADVVEIHVETKPTRRLASILFQAIFWIMLVGSIAISRLYLGGSFLVELIAAGFAIAMLINLARRSTGKEVKMSVPEVRAWLDEGAPRDVLEWRAARAATVVRMPRGNR